MSLVVGGGLWEGVWVEWGSQEHVCKDTQRQRRTSFTVKSPRDSLVPSERHFLVHSEGVRSCPVESIYIMI